MSDNERLKSSLDNAGNDEDWLELEEEGFEDIDFNEEFKDESNNTDTAEDSISAARKTKKVRTKKSGFSSLTSLGLLVLIGGGSYYYLYSVLMQPQQKTPGMEVPVVSMEPETPPEIVQEAALPNPEMPVDLMTPPEANSVAPAETPALTDNSETLKDPAVIAAPLEQPTVLTPMPSATASQNIELVPLDGAEEAFSPTAELVDNAAPTAAQPAPETLAATASTDLSETEMLEQTDKQFTQETLGPASTSADALLSEESVPPAEPVLTETVEVPATTPTPPQLTEESQSAPVIVAAAPQEPTAATPPVAEVKTATAPSIAESPAVAPAMPEPIKSQTSAPAPTTTTETTTPTLVAKPEKTETKPEEIAKAPTTEPAKAAPIEQKQPAPQPKKPAPAWKLTSAQPGSATISDPATGNMLSIDEGDRVEGIGRVKSISLVNGKWVVRGTAGSIKQ